MRWKPCAPFEMIWSNGVSRLDVEFGLCDLWYYRRQVWNWSEIALLCRVSGQSGTRAIGMYMMSVESQD